MLRFLFLYSGLVFEEVDESELTNKTEEEKEAIMKENYMKNRNNLKNIDVLPILTRVSQEQLLEHSTRYVDHSLDTKQYL